MSFVGRFEIVSPIFSGALETSTARDTNSGETVLLHLLPAGHDDAPRELFKEIAAEWPGEILDSGFDAETQRSFVITDYPKDRKAFRLLVQVLGALTVPARPKTAAMPAMIAPNAMPVPAAEPAAPEPPPVAASTMFDPSAVFGAAAAAASAPPAAAQAPASDGATRMFDPSAIFGAAATPMPAPQTPAASPDGATRMFDPSAVFAMAAPVAAKPTPPAASDGATRMFDPSAVFGAAASVAANPAPPAASDGATRMFDPSAIFGGTVPAAAAAPPATAAQEAASRMFDPAAVFGASATVEDKPAAKQGNISDSSKRAAEDFILGRLSPEFRDAPVKVQRSLEELLGRKVEEGNVQPTPGRPGVITLMFDAYGKRIEHADSSSAAASGQSGSPAADPNAAATKMISSADLSAAFGPIAASPSAAPPEIQKRPLPDQVTDHK